MLALKISLFIHAGLLHTIYFVIKPDDYKKTQLASSACDFLVELSDQARISVRAVLPGKFILLDEDSILVSAVYDIDISGKEELKKPVTMHIEHCVNVENEEVAQKMSFVVAHREGAIFKLKKTGGVFKPRDICGSIKINKSCLIGITLDKKDT